MMESAQVLETEEVNGHLMSIQHLAGKAKNVLNITKTICGLHSTLPMTPYISLWARIDNFNPEQLDKELYNSRTLARIYCMRNTIHCVPSPELPIFARATNAQGEREFARFVEVISSGGSSSLSIPDSLSGFSIESTRGRILDLLESTGPMTGAEISERIPELRARIGYGKGREYAGTFSLGSRVISGLCLIGDLIRTRPRGTWRSNLWEYATMKSWLPSVNLDSISTEEAKKSLVEKYLRAYGPATPEDIAWWGGFSISECRKTIGMLGDETIKVKIGGKGPDALMMSDVDMGEKTAHGTHLLPSLDPYVMAYRDRSRFLPPEYSVKVFDRNGNSMPVVMVDGRIIGIWMEEKDALKIMVWEGGHEQDIMDKAVELGSMLGHDGKHSISPYPDDVYVKTLFKLGRHS